MPNIRILAQAILKISCWQGFSIGMMAESKRGIFHGTRSKNYQVVQTLILTYMPNIRIINQGGLKTSCWEGFSIAIMAESKKGHNLVNILRNSVKRLSGHLNSDPNLYVKHKYPSSSGSQDIVLIRFPHCYKSRVEKKHNSVNISRNSPKS